ncbi:serine/threonine protein kinase [Kwoniella heveanensis BCC8398]|uniref:Serine/threonine protein kinase n=1 Tax=Kwoniella heveanensis BCC8398 TaxID=1296120 RepID=A0A1B9GQE6_9TREE|nr:serine/threonine protein kinase [Kwoniella heveanensis BCC8398]
MSLLRESPSHPILPPASSSTAPASSMTGNRPSTTPRSSTASSRNDLFTTSWQPELPPPRPLGGSTVPVSHSHGESGLASGSIFGGSSGFGHAHTAPSPSRKREVGLKMDFDGLQDEFSGVNREVDEFGVTIPRSGTYQAYPQPKFDKGKISPSPRTSSFFDMPSETITPPPAPRIPTLTTTTGTSSFAPSPLTLSRSSSIRRVPPPLPLNGETSATSSVLSSAAASTGPSRKTSGDEFTDPLSPLHQSPQLPPTSSGGLEGWQPPLPPSSDDIELRLMPNSTYLLGEGRYARVYLASYKRSSRSRKAKGRARDLLGRAGSTSARPAGYQDVEVNEDGDGLVGGSWKLCAAKRLAPDRESQTMGLREAFFLNRLAGASKTTTAQTSSIYSPRGLRPRQRAVSPLRDTYAPERDPSTSALRLDGASYGGRDAKMRKKPRPNGAIYVVKLIAVKEDREGFPSISQTHARSSSDALAETGSSAAISGSGELRRQRSSTIITAHAPLPPNSMTELTHLSSFPSLPSLAQSVRHEQSAPSLSRLVLLLEHAPLGTLDRMLRISPQLVGKALWERWAREGAEALEWVHGKGVVHADVKPGNLLLTTDLHLRLSDFGSSLLIHPSHPPTDGLGLGTLPFSPPELVDPTQTFSFPVDIFALGATLYQCITGREPFRGSRTIEMMHHVRKGGLWAYEEPERLHRVGNDDGVSTSGSPYPSAWRGYPSATSGAGYPSGALPGTAATIGGIVRRGGSLRIPPSHSREHLSAVVEKPRLKRMTSAESIRASDEAGSSESPAGVKLWANWVKSGPAIVAGSSTPSSTVTAGLQGSGGKSGGPGVDAITQLLSDGDEFDLSPTAGISRVSSMRKAQENKLGAPSSSRPQPVRGHSSSSLSGASSTSDSNTNSSPSPYPHSRREPERDREPCHRATVSPPEEPRLQAPTPESTGPNTPAEVASDTEQQYIDAETLLAAAKALHKPYDDDGSPAMIFLDGLERVSEEVRDVLRNMLSPDQRERMSAQQVRERWDELGVGLDEIDEIS